MAYRTEAVSSGTCAPGQIQASAGKIQAPAGESQASANAKESAGESESSRRRRVFKAEVERLMNRLYGTAVHLARSDSDAEDLVAESLTKAWSRLDSLEDLRAFEKWIFRILTNTFVSSRRRSRETPVSELARQDDGDPVSLVDRLQPAVLLWSGNPEQRFLDRLLREDIERALDGLPDQYRLTLILVDVRGFTYAEAAEILSIPVGTIRSRLFRGRRLFQDALCRQACPSSA